MAGAKLIPGSTAYGHNRPGLAIPWRNTNGENAAKDDIPSRCLFGDNIAEVFIFIGVQ